MVFVCSPIYVIACIRMFSFVVKCTLH